MAIVKWGPDCDVSCYSFDSLHPFKKYNVGRIYMESLDYFEGRPPGVLIEIQKELFIFFGWVQVVHEHAVSLVVQLASPAVDFLGRPIAR